MALPLARSLVVLFTVLTLAACGGGGAPGGPGGAGGFGGMASFKPNVTVVTLKTQPVALTRELPGRTSAFLVADVRPQVSGIVKRRLFDGGRMVQGGPAAVRNRRCDLPRAARQRARGAAEGARRRWSRRSSRPSARAS